jgi:hypothetical protein
MSQTFDPELSYYESSVMIGVGYNDIIIIFGDTKTTYCGRACRAFYRISQMPEVAMCVADSRKKAF